MVPNRLLWLYYNFCETYGRKPDDIEDMCDGLLVMRAKAAVEEIYSNGEN